MTKGAYLSVWFPDKTTVRKLGALAALEGISRSELVRRIVARELERRDSLPPLVSEFSHTDHEVKRDA